MTFYLDDKEIEKFNTWKDNLPNVTADCLDVFGKEFQYTFKFHPLKYTSNYPKQKKLLSLMRKNHLTGDGEKETEN